jgi:hypothetical protein
MKKTKAVPWWVWAILALATLLFAILARGADAWFGTKGATNNMHPDTNYFLLVMGDGTNSVIRKMNRSNVFKLATPLVLGHSPSAHRFETNSDGGFTVVDSGGSPRWEMLSGDIHFYNELFFTLPFWPNFATPHLVPVIHGVNIPWETNIVEIRQDSGSTNENANSAFTTKGALLVGGLLDNTLGPGDIRATNRVFAQKVDANLLTNLVAAHFNYSTLLIPTNNALSNIVCNYADTNTVLLFITNNVTLTNRVGLADGRNGRKRFIIIPQLITRGINHGLGIGFASRVMTNAANTVSNTVPAGSYAVIDDDFIGTNIIRTLTMWQ